MKSKYNIHRADEKFHIRIEKLNSGWMFTRITVNRSNFWHMFDEGISEPTIDLMKTYLAVRDCGEAKDSNIWHDNKIFWYWSDHTELHFEIEHLKEDLFRLSVDAQLYEGENIRMQKSVAITRDELLSALDVFFQQILHDKGFPFQYPAGCEEYIDGTSEKADAMLKEILQLLPKRFTYSNSIYAGIENICLNAVAELAPESQAYVDDYRWMLETYTIPERWK